MHRIVTPAGQARQSRYIRWAGMAAYALFVAAGALLLVSPIIRETYGLAGVVMCWFIVVGGSFAAVGTSMRWWMGEFIGTPMLSVGFATFGLLIWLNSHDTAAWVAYGNLAMLLGLSGMLTIRFRMVFAIYHFVHLLAEMTDE